MGRGAAPAAETASYPNDLTNLPGGSSVTPHPGEGARVKSKRKQTLLSLLDALNELSKDDDLASSLRDEQPSFEDDRDVPTVDEHLQKEGADAFNRFQRRIVNLDKELRNFANATRQLGSSVGILSSSFHLRERLAQIQYLFRENAADLFPRKVHRQPREQLVNPHLRHFKKSKRTMPPPHIASPIVLENLDPEDFPHQLRMFANDYWASCLKAYEGQFKYPAVQRYLHDLSTEMGEHLDNITSSLSIFIEIGVPTIRFAQKHAAANLLNLSTVATFFSAVTATTLQFSFNQVDSALANSVNGFWFTSLVFSIGAAVNSLLGLTWKQAMYRSPGHRVPWWVLIWIKRSPLVFLVLSVACFSIGLVLFAYSSGQHKVTATVTTVFSACSCFGLAAVSTWFASERYIFTRHKGKKWLADVLSETQVRLSMIPGIAWVIQEPQAAARKAIFWMRRFAIDVKDVAVHVTKCISCMFNIRDPGSPSTQDSVPPLSPIPPPNSPTSPEKFSPIPVSNPLDVMTLHPISEVASSSRGRSLDGTDDKTVFSDASAASPQEVSPAKRRFAQLVHSVMMMRSTAHTAFNVPKRQRTSSSDGTRPKRPAEPVNYGMMRSSRVAALVPKLKSLQTTQDLEAHQALVRHLQFSPNGKKLATSSWDRTSVIFEVGEPFTIHRILAHPQGFVGQVAWSPSGSTLLTKMNHGIRVWTQDGVLKKNIVRPRTVHSVAWLPGGEAFLSVESSHVTKLDLHGNALGTYHFERMILHDVAVTQDSQRMLCVGTLTASEDNLHPSKSRAEKQIIAYNLDKQEIENRVPVLHDVRDITLARNDQVALVSYENKAPPQLWKVDMVKDTARLSLRHTYMPKVSVDFAGPSYFGGKYDELVLCAGKAGDIHIWDRESAALLHHVRAQALGGDLTCIAWNPAVDPFMFATGSHDGAVRIWTTSDLETLAEGPPPSRVATHPANTPRTASPSPFDANYRTESPSIATGYDSQDGHWQSGNTDNQEQDE